MILRFLAAIALFGATLAVVDSTQAQAQASIAASPQSVDFGEVFGTTEAEQVTFTNQGSSAVIGAVTVTPGFLISSDSCTGSTVGAGQTCIVLIAPDLTASAGSKSGQLDVRDVDGSDLATVSLSMVYFRGVLAIHDASRGITSTYSSLDTNLRVVRSASSIGVSVFGTVQVQATVPSAGVFTAGDVWTGLPTRAGTGELGNLQLDGCTTGAGSFEVINAEYSPGGDLEVLSLGFISRCLLYPGYDYGLLHFSNRAAGPEWVIGPTAIDTARVLNAATTAASFVYNASTTPIAPSIDTSDLGPTLTGDAGAGCSTAILPGSACAVIITAPTSAPQGVVTASVAVSIGGDTTVVDVSATRDTAVYLKYRPPFGFSGPTLVYRDIHTPGQDMVVNSFDPGQIMINYVDEGSTWGVNGISLGTRRVPFPGPGVYDITSGTTDATSIAVTSNSLCFNQTGTVTVHAIEQNSERITRLSADLVVYCDSNIPSFLVALRYNDPFGSPLFGSTPPVVEFGSVSDEEQHELDVSVTNLGNATGEVSASISGSRYFSLVGAGCSATVLAPAESCRQTIALNAPPNMSELVKATVVFDIAGNALAPVTIDFEALIDTPDRPLTGYWVLQANGQVTSFGDAQVLSAGRDGETYIHIEPKGDEKGYWALTDDGTVYSAGSATFYGSVPSADRLAFEVGEVVATMSRTPTGNGYWIFTNRGRVLRFGDANDIGDLLDFDLSGSIVASAASPSGNGAYMIGSDGGVFALGDARFAGSIPQVLPGTILDQAVVGIVADPDGTGYWLVAADGGVFGFDAPFRGSIPGVLAPGTQLAAPVNGMVPYADGYLLVASDGGVFNFSQVPFSGSLGNIELDSPVVAIAPLA